MTHRQLPIPPVCPARDIKFWLHRPRVPRLRRLRPRLNGLGGPLHQVTVGFRRSWRSGEAASGADPGRRLLHVTLIPGLERWRLVTLVPGLAVARTAAAGSQLEASGASASRSTPGARPGLRAGDWARVCPASIVGYVGGPWLVTTGASLPRPGFCRARYCNSVCPGPCIADWVTARLPKFFC